MLTASPHKTGAAPRAVSLPALRATATAFAVTAACTLLATHAFAQGPASTPQQAPGQGGSRLALGLGVGVGEPPYEGADRKVRALPLLFYENDWVRVAGLTAEAKLLDRSLAPGHRLTGGLQLRYVPYGYEANDSPRLAGMAERKESVMGGVGATWHNPLAQVSLDWNSDLSGNSKGQRVSLQVERRFQMGKASLTPRLGAQWMDRKWVDYYFGVRAQEALADRPAYSGDAAVAWDAGLRMDYALQPRHVVFLDLGVTRLPKEATNSPIVDRSNIPRASVGYLYRF